MNEGLKLMLQLKMLTDKIDRKIKTTGTSILDTTEMLQSKIDIAEVLVKLSNLSMSEDFSDVEKKTIEDVVMETRIRYHIQSGIYAVAESRIAEREKND